MTYDLQIYIVVQPCTWYMHKKKVKSEKKNLRITLLFYLVM